MLASCNVKEQYCELQMMVCDINNEACMQSDCSKCPGKEAMSAYLVNENMICADDNSPVTFQQWVPGLPCTLETAMLPPYDFVDHLTHKLDALKYHHYVSKRQSEFLRHLKDSLPPDEGVILMDFAENYNFIVQESPQFFYWNQGQATIHPLVLYHRTDSDTNLRHQTFAVISDFRRHDNAAVNTFQTELMRRIRADCPHIKKLHYFTDGAASQYKNKKCFVNLCHHYSDFSIRASWHFHATSHDKGPCDGVGGTLKRLVAKASIQRPREGQILKLMDQYTWAEANLDTITSIWAPEEQALHHQDALKSRYDSARAVPETRKYHCFEPVSR